MTLPSSPTIVDYPSGAVESSGTVLHREVLGDGRAAILLDRTAAHPVDSAWPDQGPDRGILVVDGLIHPLLDVIVAATDGHALFVGADIPVRKGTEGWTFVVAHLVDGSGEIAEGDDVEVSVDEEHRAGLSVGHTACHLASLALNRALADAWSKDVATDALGTPNFDALAVDTTSILENGSRDDYRIGKSLRKKGFSVAALDELDAIAAVVDAQLAEWVATGAEVRIERAGDGLTDLREWVCDIEGGARIPCGGTHAVSLSALNGIRVTLERSELDGAFGLTMRTSVAAAD
ncbi:metal-dependent hydrolase [Naasia lichenicola]|uniref:Metal-dependent hydrolase n=1 Tax=Naasia lichenicola TaxID=2565933 RepID=A0A4S4FRG7_9MICO|nr:metal-dependent hydrolase [Naasia lichenicola]THG32964.1 metal-dependent hydrolase [Naasia lichenicola]